METKNLYKSIFDVGEEYKESLIENSPSSSGDLKDSYVLKANEDSFIIEGNSYFKYVDEGVNGVKQNRGSIFSYTNKKPPISGLMDWANKRSINPFAVQNSIFNKGIEARGILDKVSVDNVEDILTQGYIKDIKEDLEKTYK